MGLVRGVSKMSLGTWGARASKYQKFINLANVFLTVTSTILVFLAIVLMKFYHLDKLGFWSIWFVITPYLMVGLGLFTFCICVYGFLISNQENRSLLIPMVILISMAFLGQIVSIISALEVRNT